MNSSIFIDTSALIAIMNKKDQYHARAIDIFTATAKGKNSIIITSHVFAETITRIERKVSVKQAILAGKMLLNNNGIKIIIPQEDIIDSAWNIFQKYQDQEFSFVECISFAVMKEMRITKAFAFDKHFKIVGFETL